MDAYATTEHDLTSGFSLDHANAGTNGWTTTTGPTDDQCVEKWTLAAPAIRCVRLASSASRPFTTTDTGQRDFDLGYRPFMISAGWVFESQAAAPQKMAFDRQVVDFGDFLRPAPESDFNSAMTMGATCAAITAAVLT